MQLYDYYRSTAAYRVRIALNLKNVEYDTIPVHLLNNGGEQHADWYHALNPLELVPSLQHGPHLFTQSLAIIDYLNDTIPSSPLLPSDPIQRAKIRAFALTIACDVHPINCLRVINQLKIQFKASQENVTEWMHHWFQLGFTALEQMIQQESEVPTVCFGNQVSLADICLVPQVYSAKRFGFDLHDYPRILAVNDYCLTLESFIRAAPDSTNLFK